MDSLAVASVVVLLDSQLTVLSRILFGETNARHRKSSRKLVDLSAVLAAETGSRTHIWGYSPTAGAKLELRNRCDRSAAGRVIGASSYWSALTLS